ncbi:MAG TPA: HEAT repeat domain-containing protein [Phycisphaerae bacterium]|nr:HEAT repeat domain-containing protein [Phycisphaerae bacterium]
MARASWLLTAGIVSAIAVAAFSEDAAPPTPDQLLAVLRGNAPLPAKWDAARLLARTAPGSMAPALADLLGDPKVGDLARCALEAMPGPAADDALRAALPGLKGTPLVGAIQSIGVRRDAKAVEPLAHLLAGADAEAASAAAFALGRIASAPAAQALAKAEGTAPPSLKGAIQESLLQAADAAAAQGRADEAVAVYDRLRTSQGSSPVRMAAVRGAIVARGPAGLPLLLEYLGGDDLVALGVALRVATDELRTPEVTRALADAVAKLPADRRPMVIQALGNRGDAAALPALLAAAKTGDKPLRLAALRTLARLADAQAVPVLATAAGDADAEVASAAQNALLGLPGKEVGAEILGMVDGPEVGRRLLGVRLAQRRALASAMPALLKAAKATEPPLRLAALRTIRDLAGEADLPALLDLLAEAQGAQERDTAERATALAVARSEHPDACVDRCVARMAAGGPEFKGSLLRVLRGIGGPKALQTVRAALSDPALQDAAIRAMTDWPDLSAGKDLLDLATSAPQANYRILAFRGFLRLADQNKSDPKGQLKMIDQARQMAKSAETKRLVLGTLAGVKDAAALQMGLAMAQDTEVRAEGVLATLKVAEALARSQPAAVREAMKELAQIAPDAGVQRKIQAVLNATALAPASLGQNLQRDPARSEATRKELAKGAPKGFHLACYLDCGPDGEDGAKGGPRLRLEQGRPHIWSVATGTVAPRYVTCFYWEDKVVFQATGLKAGKTYQVGLAWWDVDHDTRKGSVWALTGSGEQETRLVEPTAIPSWQNGQNPPQELTVALPAKVHADGTMRIEVRNEGQPNIVVSELWLWESD